MIKVCHMTSAHNSDDTRIFQKECVSLAKFNYDVTLVAPGKSREEKGVHVIGVGKKPTSRLKRMREMTKKVYDTALKVDADLYHLHDPELLPYAIKLKNKGKTVLFDSHEDYASTVAIKSYIPKLFRNSVQKLYSNYEKKVFSKIDGVIACYHWTKKRVEKDGTRACMVFNYPIISSEFQHISDYQTKAISYAGGISSQWCHQEIIDALDEVKNAKYVLAGNINSEYGQKLRTSPGWKYVDYCGLVPFHNVFKCVYDRSSIGIALLDYIPQCKGKIGNLSNTKLFEYMYAGLPVICTDFVLWKEIIDEYKCGICVNPHNIEEIKKAIDYLIHNPKEAEFMGKNGIKAVEEKYNWLVEEKKLLKFYTEVLGDRNECN